jgi:hypothetical protein
MKVLTTPQSGSVGGVTAGHGRAGQFVRSRRKPVQVGSARQFVIRSAMGAASSAWSSLTPTEQASWAAAAAAHPIADALGQSMLLSGHQFFVRCQSQRLNIGLGADGPVPVDYSLFGLGDVTSIFWVGIGLSVELGVTLSPLQYVTFSLSRPVSGGRTSSVPVRQVGVLNGISSSYWFDWSDYCPQFGSAAVGQNVILRMTPVIQSGLSGVPSQVVLRVQPYPVT